MKIFKFQTRESMVAALSVKYISSLRRAIELREHASWAVSGGSTPQPLFETMSVADLPWSKIIIALVDERWVPTNHDRSNAAFVKRHLLKDNAAEAQFIPMRNDADASSCSADFANEQYAKMSLPFDRILLGMGGDGHTASLFPGADGLEEAMEADSDLICAAITAKRSDITGDELERITLTAAEICRARTIDLMITGEDKMRVFKEAMVVESNYPIGRLMRMAPEKFEIYWSP